MKPATLYRAFTKLYRPARYKVFYGGRGGMKSWQFAEALVGESCNKQLRILCTREFQSSIADSVYRLLVDTIYRQDLQSFFTIQKNGITNIFGSEFIFKGLRHNIQEIKSLEGVDRCWVEEAQSVSNDSWQILIPTIRKEGSEIWISFNTGEADDPTYTRFVLDPPPNTYVFKVGWQDNPFFPATLEAERSYLQRVDPEAYDHVWEGNPLHLSDACVLKGKYRVESFDTPDDVVFRYGSDWGFSVDPTTLVRSFVKDNKLYVDYEAYGVGVELDDIPELFDTVPGSREWPIWADNSRPETISHLKKKASESRALPRHGNVMIQRPMPRDLSRKVLRTFVSLRSSSYTSAVSMRPMKPNGGATRKIQSQTKSCLFCNQETNTFGMRSDMPTFHKSRVESIGRPS
jgi:phage terminase large subunit